MKKYRKTKLGGRNVASISTVTTTKILLDYVRKFDHKSGNEFVMLIALLIGYPFSDFFI